MEPKIKALQELITDNVVPHERKSVNIIPDHVTMLEGTKSKKQLSRKRRAAKAKTLTRRNYAELGLNCLPKRTCLTYDQALELHNLWKDYMRTVLDLKNGDNVPQLHEKQYAQFMKKVIKLDFHGAKLSVINSICATLLGLTGIVVLETRRVIKILNKDNRIRTIPKMACDFEMRLGNIKFIVFGKSIMQRPYERANKKIKTAVKPAMI